MSEDLINFVNPKNGIYYKTLKEIELFLMIRYGVSPNSYFYDFRFNENGFTKSYCEDLNYRYANNRVILILPEHNQFFLMSMIKSKESMKLKILILLFQCCLLICIR